MMVAIDKICMGATKFVDREIMPSLPPIGWQKVAIGSAIALCVKRAGKIAESYKDNKVVCALGVMDKDGNVDIDALRDVVKQNIPDSGMVVEVPILGRLTFTKSDIDNLYNDIMS